MSEIETQEVDLLRFTTAGSVDDGKSTLIGRLLYDSKQIYDDVLSSMNKTSERAGKDQVDLALLTDGLKAEREQGITIDVAYRYFSTPKRRFIIADTPGHEQYTRNMVTGASTANLAIILIDARKGVLEQSRRHAIIASLLRIPHIIVAVNKMDLVDWSEEVFNSIKKEFAEFSSTLGLNDTRFCPISALTGDNVVNASKNMPWYKEQTIMHYLENIELENDLNLNDFRLPVQCIIRPHLDFRGFAGQIASGIIKKGDEIITYPSQKTSKVKGIHTFEGEIDCAYAPMSVTVTLEDEIDISRGDIIATADKPMTHSSEATALICWMGDEELELDEPYFIKHSTHSTQVTIKKVNFKLDINNLQHSQVKSLKTNEVGLINIKTQAPLNYDSYLDNRFTGSFIIVDPFTNNTIAAGMLIDIAKDSTKLKYITP